MGIWQWDCRRWCSRWAALWIWVSAGWTWCGWKKLTTWWHYWYKTLPRWCLIILNDDRRSRITTANCDDDKEWKNSRHYKWWYNLPFNSVTKDQEYQMTLTRQVTVGRGQVLSLEVNLERMWHQNVPQENCCRKNSSFQNYEAVFQHLRKRDAIETKSLAPPGSKPAIPINLIL